MRMMRCQGKKNNKQLTVGNLKTVSSREKTRRIYRGLKGVMLKQFSPGPKVQLTCHSFCILH